MPALLTLTSKVVRSSKSRSKTSCVPLLSLGTRSLAALPKTTKRPSALTNTDGESANRNGESELPLPVPTLFPLTRLTELPRLTEEPPRLAPPKGLLRVRLIVVSTCRDAVIQDRDRESSGSPLRCQS